MADFKAKRNVVAGEADESSDDEYEAGYGVQNEEDEYEDVYEDEYVL